MAISETKITIREKVSDGFEVEDKVHITDWYGVQVEAEVIAVEIKYITEIMYTVKSKWGDIKQYTHGNAMAAFKKVETHV